jgi:hypothetical protein
MLGIVLQDVGSLMGEIFNAPPEGKGEAWKNLFKMFANQLITFLEIQLLGATASSIFQAIISGGFSLFKTMPELIAGAVAMEALRGLIGGLAEGTPDTGSTGKWFITGEKGPELGFWPAHSSVINNNNFQKIANENRAFEMMNKAPVVHNHNHFRIDLNKGEFFEDIRNEYLRDRKAK